MAGRMIAQREAQIAELTMQIDAFQVKFDRWRCNASRQNVKIEGLDAALPKPVTLSTSASELAMGRARAVAVSLRASPDGQEPTFTNDR